jgi:hypothetical protein
MTSSRHILITQLLTCAAAAVASVGCGASVTSLRAPVQPVGVDAAVGPLGDTCTVEGGLRSLATKVAPYAGVNAQADASRVLLRFSHQRSALALALAVDPQSLDPVDGTESAGPMFVVGSGESLAGGTTPVLWQTPAAEADEVELPVAWESGDSRASKPVVARVDSERSVAVWNAGSIYTGEDVHIMMVDRRGVPIGAPVTLPSGGRAFGTPTVAVASSGRGVVAFLQSGDHGFELVAASLDCHVPAAPDTSAAWAMQTSP